MAGRTVVLGSFEVAGQPYEFSGASTSSEWSSLCLQQSGMVEIPSDHFAAKSRLEDRRVGQFKNGELVPFRVGRGDQNYGAGGIVVVLESPHRAEYKCDGGFRPYDVAGSFQIRWSGPPE